MMNVVKFREELDKFMDLNSPNFEGHPPTHIISAQRMSVALGYLWSSSIPLVVPQSVEAAKVSYVNTMSVPLARVNSLIVLPNALMQFAVQIALGMQPLFSAVPPPIPVNLLPVIVGNDNLPISAILDKFVTTLVTWFKTGTAVNNSSGVLITWQ
jgi:hypothetical protein